MKKLIKGTLRGAGVAGLTAYGLATAANEALFNRKITFSQEFGQKMSGCDNSHLGEFLENNLKWLENHGYERHFIVSDRGYRLTGYLVKPEKESDVYVFGAHGYRSRGRREFSKFVQYYIEKGYNVFLPDHVASGESEGLMCTFGYNEREDCMKWLSYLIDTFGKERKIILHGVSMGCATVTMMSGNDRLPANIKFTVADCGYTSAKDEFMHNVSAVKLAAMPVMAVADKFNKLISGYKFKDVSPLEAVKNAKVPMLFIHGSIDDFVPTKMCYELYNNCSAEDKDILIVEGAAHAESYPVDSASYEAKINKFAEKYIR